MNLVDSCGWLEYFADGPNADFYEEPLTKQEELLVPSLCIYEVFKSLLRQKGEDAALHAAGVMNQGHITEFDAESALCGAKISAETGLPTADSIIYAAAQKHNAVIWTQDADFRGMKNVKYIARKR